MGHLLPGCDEVHLITIVPRGQAAGHTLSLPGEEHDNMSRSQMLDQICMCLGGHAAEKVGLGEIYTGSSSDLKRATGALPPHGDHVRHERRDWHHLSGK